MQRFTKAIVLSFELYVSHSLCSSRAGKFIGAEDHESSAIDAGLRLGTIRNKFSNELWNWFVKSSIQEALSPVKFLKTSTIM